MPRTPSQNGMRSSRAAAPAQYGAVGGHSTSGSGNDALLVEPTRYSAIDYSLVAHALRSTRTPACGPV